MSSSNAAVLPPKPKYPKHWLLSTYFRRRFVCCLADVEKLRPILFQSTKGVYSKFLGSTCTNSVFLTPLELVTFNGHVMLLHFV